MYFASACLYQQTSSQMNSLTTFIMHPHQSKAIPEKAH